jgi:hypothetical protein
MLALSFVFSRGTPMINMRCAMMRQKRQHPAVQRRELRSRGTWANILSSVSKLRVAYRA